MRCFVCHESHVFVAVYLTFHGVQKTVYGLPADIVSSFMRSACHAAFGVSATADMDVLLSEFNDQTCLPSIPNSTKIAASLSSVSKADHVARLIGSRVLVLPREKPKPSLTSQEDKQFDAADAKSAV